MEDTVISNRDYKYVVCRNQFRAFTLIELLVVIANVAMLMTILVPALGKVKQKAETLLGMNNQRQIASGVTIFTSDNNGWYPESVATLGEKNWNWSDPRQLIAKSNTYTGIHRAMSEHLRSYIDDASIMYCANAPRKYKYLQALWDAGDDWDYPDIGLSEDPATGTYCFYWSYTGYLEGRPYFFKGPQRISGRPGHSKLLMSDYFGYNHYRARRAYGSCEKFKGASVTVPEKPYEADFWFRDGNPSVWPDVKLHAAYTDGHVESYTASDVVPMKVILRRDIGTPYPDWSGPGIFYLPKNGLR